MNEMARIPLSLVTGFLGSGKTTFLKYTADRLAGQPVVYLVNEFSSLDVDGQDLRQIGPDTICIPGGSIFCKCLVGEFITALSEIPEKFCSPAKPIAGVIVEASGIANPKVVADMLRETKLDAVYGLSCVVAVVDPGSFGKLLVTLPNIRAQVEAADVILVNKVDLFDQKDIAATEAAVRQIRPEARIVRTIRGAADIELFGEPPVRDIHGQYALCADPYYARFSVTFDHSVDLKRLRAAISDLGEDLYRVKGFVPTMEGTMYLDRSAAGLSVESRDAGGVEPGLAMIARADRPQRVEQFIEDIEAGRFA